MNVSLKVSDGRTLKYWLSALSLRHGTQLEVDITSRCSFSSRDEFRSNSGKEVTRTTTDIISSWLYSNRKTTSCQFRCRSDLRREIPSVLQRSAFLTWRRRWTRMIVILVIVSLRARSSQIRLIINDVFPDLEGLFRKEELSGDSYLIGNYWVKNSFFQLCVRLIKKKTIISKECSLSELTIVV